MSIYGQQQIFERHRHRYEFNNKYLTNSKAYGMFASGINRNQTLVEIIELQRPPMVFGVLIPSRIQKYSRKHHPLFEHFVKAAIVFKSHDPKKLNSIGHPQLQRTSYFLRTSVGVWGFFNVTEDSFMMAVVILEMKKNTLVVLNSY
jgi:hypothetical protein